MFKGETTEWDDIQVRFGNYSAPAPKSPSLEAQYKETMELSELVAAKDRVALVCDSVLSNNNANESNHRDDGKESDIEDEDALERIRARRLDQLRRKTEEQLQQRDHNYVSRVTRETYTELVTNRSKNGKYVLLYLQDSDDGDVTVPPTFLSDLIVDFNKAIKQLSSQRVGGGGPSSSRGLLFVSVGSASDILRKGSSDNTLDDQRSSVGNVTPLVIVYYDGSCVLQIPKANESLIKRQVLDLIVLTAKRDPQQQQQQSDDDDSSSSDIGKDDSHNIKQDERIRQEIKQRQGKDDREYSSTFFQKYVLRH